ncbi:uncharacterized protein KY384_002645 [Bacidia gigantensis]|uniref:uncharacterized protein n=1 Tax=Bacidia gigantensis TaxID=2732470 RepID=UPI001D059396|nr:uncharacterized protein KY384_002645 [Bacidia gigantensis]KAG8532767.1 hypothetical protein KY384_002645 [Bacidia gigantensis]
MAPATEIATWSLKAGTDIDDPSSNSGKVWASTLDTVSSQPGYQRAYYGRTLENPSIFQFLVDWDSYDHHQDFVKSSIYGPFVKHLMTIVNGGFTMRHANFEPHPPSKVVGKTNAPVTEVLTAYVEAKDEGYAANVTKFGHKLQDERVQGFKGFSSGWVMENVEHEKFGEGKKGHAYVAVFGYETMEDHARVRDSQFFKDNIGLIREGAAGLQMHHVCFDEK